MCASVACSIFAKWGSVHAAPIAAAHSHPSKYLDKLIDLENFVPKRVSGRPRRALSLNVRV